MKASVRALALGFFLFLSPLTFFHSFRLPFSFSRLSFQIAFSSSNALFLYTPKSLSLLSFSLPDFFFRLFFLIFYFFVLVILFHITQFIALALAISTVALLLLLKISFLWFWLVALNCIFFRNFESWSHNKRKEKWIFPYLFFVPSKSSLSSSTWFKC